MMAREVGLPLALGIRAYARQDYAAAAELIHATRDGAHRFGGSHAQRDLLSLTLIDAAHRAGLAPLARHILAERQVLKPTAWSERLAARVGARRFQRAASSGGVASTATRDDGVANDPSDATRLERTLAKTTAAALAVSRTEGRDVFAELAAGLARNPRSRRDDDRALRRRPRRAGSSRSPPGSMAGCCRPSTTTLHSTPCRAMVGRDSRFVAAGVRAEFRNGTLFHAQGFDSYAAHSMTDASGRQIGLIVALHRQPMTDRALTEALLQIFAVRAAAELERQRAAAEARASEASYRAIFDATEDAIFVHDFDTGRVLDVNPKACRNYGYTHDELLQVRIADVSSNVPPYTEDEAARHMDLARRGAQVRFEWRRRNKDGSLHWDEVELKRATIGGHERILAFTREITDRKEALETLRLREEQYRAIFEGSADALVLWSRDVRIVDVNAAFTAMYGYTRDEIVGSTFGDRLPTLDIARRILMMQRALEGETGHLETRTIRKSGESFDVEIRYLPILHRGEPHVLAIARDITERRRAEQALRDSEEQYRAIFNASADALVLRDADFRIVDVNATYEAMSGFPRDMVLGIDRVIANPPEVAERIRSLHARALAGAPIGLETTLVRRDGTRYDLELRGVPIQHRGAPHVLYMGRDVTARRQEEDRRHELESQLRQAQKMEAIGHLTGGIAHDFNNILTSVMGYMALASERPAAAADARLQSHLEQALLSCQRARDLIQQMLAFSRGRRSEPRPVALRPLVNESTRMLRATLPATHRTRVTRRRRSGRSRRPRAGAPGGAEPVHQRARCNGGKRSHRRGRRTGAAERDDVLELQAHVQRGVRRSSPSPTPERASGRKSWSACSTPSSAPRTSATAPAWACRSSTAWSTSTVATSWSNPGAMPARRFACCCRSLLPRPTIRRPAPATASRPARRCPDASCWWRTRRRCSASCASCCRAGASRSPPSAIPPRPCDGSRASRNVSTSC